MVELEQRVARLRGRLIVCGRFEIDGFRNAAVTHLLSIDNSPESGLPAPRWFGGVHEAVYFADADDHREAVELGGVAPSDREVRKAIEFGYGALEMAEGTLLVHCAAGVSRSPAVAFAIVAKILGGGHEVAALELVLELRDLASPNSLVVELADKILDKRGRLIDALELLRERIRNEREQRPDPHNPDRD